MKKTLVGVTAAAALMLGGGQVVAFADPADPVSIPDESLLTCINSRLGGGRQPDATVTEAEPRNPNVPRMPELGPRHRGPDRTGARDQPEFSLCQRQPDQRPGPRVGPKRAHVLRLP